MKLKWYDKPLRIVALQCNYEKGKTFEVVDKWSEMGFNVEQLFHPMADGHSVGFDAKRHGKILAKYVQRAKEKGLRIIVYLNVHVIPAPLIEHKNKWAQRNADGVFVKLYGTHYACCVNSPWRDYFFSVLDDIALYNIDGVFLDGPVIIKGGCYCDSCRKLYQKKHRHDLGEARDVFTFNQQSLSNFLKEAYQRFKRHKPHGIFYNNLPVTHSKASYYSLPEALSYNDIVGTEGGFMFYGPPKDAYTWKPGVTAKILEAIAPGKPRVNFMAADQKPWSWYMHTPSETKLCIAATVANGANIWYGLHGSTQLLDTPGGQAAGDIIRLLADNEEYFTATKSCARVAVMYSFDTERIYRIRTEESDLYGQVEDTDKFAGNFTEALYGFCGMLSRSSIPYDIITDIDLSPEKLERYECILLPTCACLSDSALSLIQDFVANGGNIIASFDTSLYTPSGLQRDDFELRDVFGVSYLGRTVSYSNFNYFSRCFSHPIFEGLDIVLFPAPATGLDVEPYGETKVLARFHAPMDGRYVELTEQDKPAIVLNKHGKGNSLFFTGTFAEMCNSYNPVEYRKILANAVNLFSHAPAELIGHVGNVEVVVRRQGTKTTVHLLNYAGLLPRPFELVLPQKDFQLRLPASKEKPKQVRALIEDSICECKYDNDKLVINVPVLHEYEVIVIE